MTKESAWIVLDTSGSVGAYNGWAQRVYDSVRRSLQDFYQIGVYRTSSDGIFSYGGGTPSYVAGDGTKHLIEWLQALDRSRSTVKPAQVIYITDGQAEVEQYRAEINAHNVVLIDITDTRITGITMNFDEYAEQIVEYLLHECDDACDAADNEVSCVWGEQPFYPKWSKAPSNPYSIIGSTVSYGPLKMRFYDEISKIKIDPKTLFGPYFTDFTATSGDTMTAQITTTVSLKIASRQRATVKDLKTLITEVERVGGTDESYFDMESSYRTGQFDAVVVTAVEVTEPELDPRVQCSLAIADPDLRRKSLLDIYRDGPASVRSQVEKLLTVAVEEPPKPAKKTTSRAK